MLNPDTPISLKIALIVAIVEAFKALAGENSKMSIILAVIIGVITQLAATASVQFPVIAPWIDAMYSGIELGLGAAGFYRLTKRGGTAIARGVARSLSEIAHKTEVVVNTKPE